MRVLAGGRDASATIDSGLSDAGVTGYQNDGDNEITGILVSNGDPTKSGILGGEDSAALRSPDRVGGFLLRTTR